MHIPCFACATSLEETKVVSSTSEALQYIQNKQATDEELKRKGYSESEIKEIREFSYEEAMLERAKCSDAELHAIGYTDEQIKILRAYDGSELTENSPVLAATAVCTGTAYFNGYNSSLSKLSFVYKFTWNVKPFWCGTDTMAVSWRAIAPNATTINTSATSRRATIYYYSTTTGNYYSSIDYSTSLMSGFDGYKTSYDMLINVPLQPDDTIAAWGKEGYFRISLEPDGDNVINMIKVYGAVGHVSTTITGSIGFTTGDNPWSFSFTPAEKVDTTGIASYSIKNDGTTSAI